MAGPPEVIYVDEESVACDGDAGALGHPRVWLAMRGGKTHCPYCGRVFVMRAGGLTGYEVTEKSPEGVSEADQSITVGTDPRPPG